MHDLSATNTQPSVSLPAFVSSTQLCSWLIDCDDKWKNEWTIKWTLTSTRTVACPHVNQRSCSGKCISTISRNISRMLFFCICECDIAVIQFSKHHWVTYIFRHNIAIYFVYFSSANENSSRWGENTINTHSHWMNCLSELFNDSLIKTVTWFVPELIDWIQCVEQIALVNDLLIHS